ncbi:MAG TPA: alpha-ketoacid dehydrogenase subunit beta [Gammaproteobacteria bacterium]|nr:alpha-ketoacid dehydrogenase subunit beta [Gammaproteobacteria bacterium]
MAKITMVQALTQAMAWEMEHDDSVVVLGEDVGVNGGVFRATVGLQEKFGKRRVVDTPLAEALIAGVSIGMAAQGLKPVAEIQFSGFIYPAVDQMINHAGRLRNRTRGRLHVPMVLRAPSGGGIHSPEHHSESNEALFAHMPGIRVVMPTSPRRAYGLMLASIRSPDPVVFLEPTRLYRMNKQEVEDNGEALPLDTCFVLREGADVTLVSWGAMIHESLQAAKQLAEEGVDVEVIDLATVSPIDYETILDSVEKTGRLVIVHEAPLTGGVGADVAATVAERGIYNLEAPIKRVAGYDTPIPLFKMEHDYMPSVNRITNAIKETMEG